MFKLCFNNSTHFVEKKTVAKTANAFSNYFLKTGQLTFSNYLLIHKCMVYFIHVVRRTATKI